MFICSKKALEIREGEQLLSLPAGFIGTIPNWVSDHWFLKAALRDGTVTAPESHKDGDIVKAAKRTKKEV